MGTRNLTLVQQNGAYKVAQYGQFDGYPGGQGRTVLEFLQDWDRSTFEAKVAASRFATKTDIEAINKEIKEKKLQDSWQRIWPEFSRETAAEVLQIIADARPGILLRNDLPFAGNSLMCEWAYVIDLDANTFEVFKGFNDEPLAEGDRFFNVPDMESSPGYYPVKRVACYRLDALPTLKTMRDNCDPPAGE